MAIIYSTDTDFKRKHVSKSTKENNKAHFTLYSKNGAIAKNAGCATFTIDITRRCFGTKKCILGYDKERNEILVIPTTDGNINIIKNGNPNLYGGEPYRKICMKQFLRYMG